MRLWAIDGPMILEAVAKEVDAQAAGAPQIGADVSLMDPAPKTEAGPTTAPCLGTASNTTPEAAGGQTMTSIDPRDALAEAMDALAADAPRVLRREHDLVRAGRENAVGGVVLAGALLAGLQPLVLQVKEALLDQARRRASSPREVVDLLKELVQINKQLLAQAREAAELQRVIVGAPTVVTEVRHRPATPAPVVDPVAVARALVARPAGREEPPYVGEETYEEHAPSGVGEKVGQEPAPYFGEEKAAEEPAPYGGEETGLL